MIRIVTILAAALIFMGNSMSAQVKRTRPTDPNAYKDPAYALMTDAQLDSLQLEHFLAQNPWTSKLSKKEMTQLKALDQPWYQQFNIPLIEEGYKAYNGEIDFPAGNVYRTVYEMPQYQSDPDISFVRGFQSTFIEPRGCPDDWVSIIFVVNTDGSVGPIYIKGSTSEATAKAIVDALKKMHFFSPAKIDGHPVRCALAFGLQVH